MPNIIHTRRNSSVSRVTVTVTPKKYLKLVRASQEENTIEDNNEHDLNEDQDDEDPLEPFKFDDYYTRRHQSKGKSISLGKRATGKAFKTGGKAPRGSGGKSPRAPGGAGKSPAISSKEIKQREQRVKFLEGLSNDNKTAKVVKRAKQKTMQDLQKMPVGKKSEPKRRK